VFLLSGELGLIFGILALCSVWLIFWLGLWAVRVRVCMRVCVCVCVCARECVVGSLVFFSVCEHVQKKKNTYT